MTHWTDSDSIDVWYCDSDTTVTKCYNVHSPFRLLWYFIICTIFLCISLSWCDPVWSVVCKNPSTNYHRLLLTLLQCFHFFVSFLYKVFMCVFSGEAEASQWFFSELWQFLIFNKVSEINSLSLVSGTKLTLSLNSNSARHFTNQCNICKVVKVVHGPGQIINVTGQNDSDERASITISTSRAVLLLQY